MGDTENGSWTSRELGRHINEEQARAAERVGHTPGPWEVGPYNNVHDTDTGESVAVVTDRHGEEANARLIAAAPTMLEALEDAHAALLDHEHEREARMVLAKVRAAISKATGDTDASR